MSHPRPPVKSALHTYNHVPSSDTGPDLWSEVSAEQRMDYEAKSSCQQADSSTFGEKKLLCRCCYILHVALVIIHLGLMVILRSHPEHRVIVSSSSHIVTTGLSALLQGFYTVYTAALVFITQRLTLSGVFAQRRRLTTIHDLSVAWNGLGSAVNSLWQQSKVAASTWTTLVIVTYLACISVLHIASSSIMQFEAFNDTLTSSVTSTSVWSGSYSNLTTLGSSLKENTLIVPFISYISDFTNGLANSTLYDVPAPGPDLIDASVNATTISAKCGLLSNLSISPSFNPYLTAVEFAMGDSYTGSIQTLTLWKDGISILQFFQDIIMSQEQVVPNVFFMVTTAMNLSESISSVVSVGMNWTYTLPDGTPENSTTTTYFVACSFDSKTYTATLDMQTNQLQSSMPQSNASAQSWSLWSPGGDQNFNILISDALEYLPGTEHDLFCLQVSMCIPFWDLELYIASLLGINMIENNVTSGSESSANPSVILSPYQLEEAVSQVAAQLIWLAGQVGQSEGGFQRASGEATVTKEVLQWRLNINVIPVISAFCASLVLLGLMLHMIGIPLSSKPYSICNIGVLEMLWNSAHMPVIRKHLRKVEDPSLKQLRSAGMFHVFLAETCQNMPKSRGFNGETPLLEQTLESLEFEDPSEQGLLIRMDSHRHRRGCLLFKMAELDVLLYGCYTLHAILLMLHLVLLALLTNHFEHRVTVSLNSSNFLTTVLNAALQSFYTLYTTLLVFIMQQLMFSRLITQRQKLTAIHDISGAWTGIGAAIYGLSQQVKVAASPWMIMAVMLYLASISVLHITSSTVMQFELFNATSSSPVASSLAWPGPFINLNMFNWASINSLVPLIPQLQTLSTNGLLNNTLYDILPQDPTFLDASVNATELRAQCGLLSNFTLSEDEWGIYTANASVPALGTVRMEFVPLWSDMIKLVNPYAAVISSNGSVTSMDFPVYMITTAMNLDEPTNSATSVNLSSQGTQNGTTTYYFVACSFDIQTYVGTLDMQSHELQSALAQPNTSQSWTLWSPGDVTNLNAMPTALSAATLCINFSEDCLPISRLDAYIMTLLGMNMNPLEPSSWSQSNAKPSVMLSPNQIEAAVSQVAAELLWLAGQLGESGGGFQRETGESLVTTTELRMRLNINKTPVIIASTASLIIFSLVFCMVGKPLRRSPLVSGPSILEVMWLEAHSGSGELHKRLWKVDELSSDKLRKAGMFDICLADLGRPTSEPQTPDNGEESDG